MHHVAEHGGGSASSGIQQLLVAIGFACKIGGVTQVILMIDIAKCLYVGPFNKAHLMTEISDTPSMEHAALACLHQDNSLRQIGQNLPKLCIGASIQP